MQKKNLEAIENLYSQQKIKKQQQAEYKEQQDAENIKHKQKLKTVDSKLEQKTTAIKNREQLVHQERKLRELSMNSRK